MLFFRALDIAPTLDVPVLLVSKSTLRGFSDEHKTSRQRPKSALYLMLKIVEGGTLRAL